MEKIINLNDVSDEAFAAIAEGIQKWKDEGAIATVTYRGVEEAQQFNEELRRFSSKRFNQGYLCAGFAVALVGCLMMGIDFIQDKMKNKK